MKRYKWLIIILNGICLLAFFNFSVVKKEEMRKKGRLIFLELAPVDPRSLMQGDYMLLNYKITPRIWRVNINDSIPKRGYCVINIDNKGIGRYVRYQAGKLPLHAGEYLIEYTRNASQINIGAGSYFFEEGTRAKYQPAKYGGIMTDTSGNSLLTGLYNEWLQKL